MRTVTNGLAIDTQKMEKLAELDVNCTGETKGIFGNMRTTVQRRTITLLFGVDQETGEKIVVSLQRRRFHDDGELKVLARADIEALLEGHWHESVAWEIYRTVYGEPHEVIANAVPIEDTKRSGGDLPGLQSLNMPLDFEHVQAGSGAPASTLFSPSGSRDGEDDGADEQAGTCYQQDWETEEAAFRIVPAKS